MNTDGVIVVAVSPMTGSASALVWAREEAALRKATLRVVMAWRAPRPPGAPGGRPPVGLGQIPDDPQQAAYDKLVGFVEDALGDADGVDCVAVRGAEIPVLVKEAKGAQLLVLGKPRRGPLAAVRSSLIAPQLAHRTECPIVVMPVDDPPGR